MENEKLQFVERVVEIADDMAATISSLNSHTYKNFIDQRDELRHILENFVDKVHLK